MPLLPLLPLWPLTPPRLSVPEGSAVTDAALEVNQPVLRPATESAMTTYLQESVGGVSHIKSMDDG